MSRLRGQLVVLCALVLGLLAASATRAAAGTISTCTRAAVVDAAAIGGSWTFACDAEIQGLGLTIDRAVDFDANGHKVSFSWQKSTFDPRFSWPTSKIEQRVAIVKAGGRLTLRGIDVANGIVVTTAGVAGANGTNGTDGATGTAAGAGGAPGGDARPNATSGKAAEPARGGCILVETGGTLVLRDLEVKGCQAATGPGGKPGTPGYGGAGGRGAVGASGRDEFGSVPASAGGPGGPGGPAGASAPAVDAVDGVAGEGGAIYSTGTLDIADVSFEDNVVRGGTGGGGGPGGHANAGGRGGGGGAPGRERYLARPLGGDGGAAGRNGSGFPGMPGGDGGGAHGGAIFADGTTSIARSAFARNEAYGGLAGMGGAGGSGIWSQFGEAAGCSIGATFNCTYAGKRGAPAAGTRGQDAGDNGAGGSALGGAVFYGRAQPPPTDTTNTGNQVVAGSGRAAACASGSFSGCAKGGTGGINADHACTDPAPPNQGVSTPHPPCERLPDGRNGQPGADGRAADPDVGSGAGAGLSVSLDYAGHDDPGYRLALNKPLTVTVKVRVAADAPGKVTGIAFDDAALLTELQQSRLTFSGAGPPEPFDLAPGTERTFEAIVTGVSRGATAMHSGVTGTDALRRTASAGVRDNLDVGEDIKVSVTSDPANVALEEIDPQTKRPKKQPVKLTVAIENVSGEALTDVGLDVSPRIITLIARNPSAPYPLQITRLTPPGGGADTPLDNPGAKAIAIGSMANGAKKTLVLHADAADKALMEVRARATGQASGPRTVTGTETTLVDIGQEKLVALSADGEAHRTVAPGSAWSYNGTVENLSPDEDVMVLVRSSGQGNVLGGQIEDALLAPGSPDVCTLGAFKRLEPGERLLIRALVGNDAAEQENQAALHVTVNAWTDGDAGKRVPVDPAKILIEPGADVRTATIDRARPEAFGFSDIFEAGWLLTDGAARGLGARVTGAQESVAAGIASAQSFVNTPKSVYLRRTLTYITTDMPEAYTRARSELAYTFAELADTDLEYATEVSNQAIDKLGETTVAAWNRSSWEDIAAGTGNIAGSLAPDLAMEAVLPALASCKLLKYGGKTAMLRAAERLGESRAGRLLAKGRKGLLPGDEISSLLARKLWAVDGLTDSALMRWAKAREIMVGVRDRTPGSIRRLAAGALEKIDKIKAKNVNSIDIEWLGFHETHADLAMIKEMAPETEILAKLNARGADSDTRAKVLSRLQQRREEFDKELARMREFQTAGNIPAPNPELGVNPLENGFPDAPNVYQDNPFKLVEAGEHGSGVEATTDGLRAFQPQMQKGSKYQPFTGDMDPIFILDKNGNLPPPEVREQLYREMAKLGFQHPESATWDNAAERAKYLYDYDLANGNGEALLTYMPDGTRRASYFDSRKSRWGQIGQAFILLDGANMVIGAPKPSAASTFTPEPEPDEPPTWIVPAGDDGPDYDKAEDTPIIRKNLDGTYQVWTEAGGWQDSYDLASTPKTTPQTAVRKGAAAGDTQLAINSKSITTGRSGQRRGGGDAWFEAGDRAVVDPGGPNQEIIVVQRLDELDATATGLATAGLKRPHRAGETIAAFPAVPAPPVASAPAAGSGGAGTAAPTTTTPAGGVAGQTSSAPRPRLSGAKLAGRKIGRKRGTTLTFTLDRAGTVAGVVSRIATGRRKGKACSPRARKGRKCTVRTRVKTLRVAGRPGTGKVAGVGKGLKAGRYELVLTAGGNVVTLPFAVR